MNYRTMAREDFWDYAQRARTGGKDLAEVLDREGVLLTPARKAQIRHEVMEEILVILNDVEAHRWFEPGVPHTPMDLKNQIVRWLADKSGKELLEANRG